MSLTARVKSIEALGEWKGSLKRFVGKTWELLRSAEQKIRRTEKWLQERVSYWRHEVERCEEEVWEAKRDLERCEEEDDNDCTTEEELLLEARHRLHNAKVELENVRSWMRRVDEMASAYRIQADRLSRSLATELPQADAFLGRAIADLHAYVRVTPPSEGVAVPVSSSRFLENVVSSDKPTTWQVTGTSEEKEYIQNALRRLSETERGSEIAATIQQCGTTVRFGKLPEDEIGKYRPPPLNLIVISKEYRHRSSNVLAAYLAHEGIHLQWSRGQPNTVLEECAAYKAQVEVWREVKSNESDQSCDFWDSIFRQEDGEKEAMWWVSDMRKGLAEKP